MASKRRFYRTLITVEVLSEEPYLQHPEVSDMEQIAYDIGEGDCSGSVDWGESEEVDGPTMARLLKEQGSDPEFFQLDENGEDWTATTAAISAAFRFGVELGWLLAGLLVHWWHHGM